VHALHKVLQAFFSPSSARLSLPDVWAGFTVNLKMMFLAEALVLVFALAIAIVRGLPGRGAALLRGLAVVYTDLFRGTCKEVADKVCFLDGGRILEEGPPQQIFSEPVEARTREFLARVIEAGRL
jgi:hypothetical protein